MSTALRFPPRITIFDRVWRAYEARACFLCGHFGGCKHREFRVEEAYIVAERAASGETV